MEISQIIAIVVFVRGIEGFTPFAFSSIQIFTTDRVHAPGLREACFCACLFLSVKGSWRRPGRISLSGGNIWSENDFSCKVVKAWYGASCQASKALMFCLDLGRKKGVKPCSVIMIRMVPRIIQLLTEAFVLPSSRMHKWAEVGWSKVSPIGWAAAINRHGSTLLAPILSERTVFCATCYLVGSIPE